MKTVVYPGSFDPFTVGHADILERACKLFDFVRVGVLTNKNKHQLFDADMRVEMIYDVIHSMKLSNCSCEKFDGLLVEFAKSKGAYATIRGLRNCLDFEGEITMSYLNTRLCADVESVFLMSKSCFVDVSSSAIREITKFGGSISGLVPFCIIEKVLKGVSSDGKR